MLINIEFCNILYNSPKWHEKMNFINTFYRPKVFMQIIQFYKYRTHTYIFTREKVGRENLGTAKLIYHMYIKSTNRYFCNIAVLY